MISENIHDPLIESLNESSMEIVSILKSLGNEYRFKILLQLLTGVKSFGNIVKNVNREKTAISNHLSHLINANLIEKGDYGIYKISGDGIEFMKAIDSAFQQSPTRQLKKFKELQSRKISDSFLNRFNQNSLVDR
ncbi:MAG: ArsR/SmtB family transcription factor [Promethearchaeota archaeon]